MMKHLRHILLLLACLILSGCLESTFELAPSSRLPKWFPDTEGVKREDVSVNLAYYTGGEAKATLSRHTGRKIAVVTGTVRWHPQSLTKTNSFGGFNPDAYPLYVLVTMNGIAEVIESRKMEPVFYVSDDPSLTKGLIGPTPE